MTDWDDIFRKRGWGRWPNTRFVEFAMRTFGGTDRATTRFLELGCGVGAQMRFLSDEGFDTYGIDASQVALERKKELEESGVAWLADIADAKFDPLKLYAEWHDRNIGGRYYDEDVRFDRIFDVCTLQHLLPTNARETIAKAKGWIKPGGYLWSFWAATGSDDPPADTPRPHLIGAGDIVGLFSAEDGRLTVGSEDTVLLNVRRKHWIIVWQKPLAAATAA